MWDFKMKVVFFSHDWRLNLNATRSFFLQFASEIKGCWWNGSVCTSSGNKASLFWSHFSLYFVLKHLSPVLFSAEWASLTPQKIIFYDWGRNEFLVKMFVLIILNCTSSFFIFKQYYWFMSFWWIVLRYEHEWICIFIFWVRYSLIYICSLNVFEQ